MNSIAAQTVAVREIVICDDGSGDGTARVIREFAERCGVPVRFEVNASRLGVTKNFERAISLCTGELIFLCDQDDVWEPTKVERLSACFADPDVFVAFSDAEVVNADGSSAGYRLWDSLWFDRDEQRRVREGDALPVLLRHAVAAGTTAAFRASLRPLVLPIPDFPHAHDIWIALLAGSVGKLCPLAEPLVRYRIHGSNVVGMKRHNLLGQIRMARWQLKTGQFRFAADIAREAVARLESPTHGLRASERNLALLREKVAHATLRDAMPGWPRRLAVVAREFRSGNYAKYSYGLKSVLQDLFLR